MTETWSPPKDPPKLDGGLGKAVLEPINFGLAASLRRALELGAPTSLILELLLNHLCSVAAMVEPPGAREGLIQDLVRSIAPMVNKHVDARQTTPGGVILPRR